MALRSRDDTAAPKPGDTIAGKYKIVGLLGAGGSGETFAATLIANTGESAPASTVSGTESRVAIKRFVLRGAESWKKLELFEREAAVLSVLSHPAIPRHVEAFSEDGPSGPTFYLVQGLVEGTQLDRWIAEHGTATELEARRIASQLLDVLRYIHTLAPRIIHRDIKPANILRDAQGNLHLVDFGAVREGAEDSAVGGSTVAGTYGFMAPEQYRGVATPATDLYALGATLVFLLTGRSPDQLPQKKLRVELPASLGLSAGFKAWLERLLEPAPEDRFQSAAAAMAALTGGEAPARRSRTRVLALGLALTAVAGGAVPAFFYLEDRFATPATNSAAVSPLGPEVRPRFLHPLRSFRYAPLRLEKTVDAHASLIHTMKLSPDEREAITASGDGTVKLWSTSAWSFKTVGKHERRAATALFTPDGDHIVTGDTKTIRVFDRKSLELLREKTLGVEIFSVASTTDGKRLFAGTADGKVRALSVADLTEAFTVDDAKGAGAVLSVAVSSDGKTIGAAGHSRRANLYSTETGEHLRSTPPHGATVSQVTFSPDMTLIATAGDDSRVRLSFFPLAAERVSVGATGEAWAASFSPDGSELWTGDSSGDLSLWSVTTGHLRLRYDASGPIVDIEPSKDGKRVIAATGTGQLLIFARDEGSATVPQPSTPIKEPTRPANPTAVEEATLLLESYHGDRRVLAEARRLLEKAIAANPNDASAFAELALVTVRAAHRVRRTSDLVGLAEARKHAERALAIQPTHVSALRAVVAIEKDDYTTRRDAKDPAASPEAWKRALEALAKVDPESSGTHRRFADMAVEEGNFAEARRRATKAIELATKKGELHNGYDALLDVARHQQLTAEMAAIYEAEIKLDPDSAWEKGNYAAFLMYVGRLDDARQWIKAAREQMNYGAARITHAKIEVEYGINELWNRQLPASAREFFEDALELDPRSADAMYGLIAVDYYENKEGDYAARLKKVLQVEPDHYAAKRALNMLGANR